MLSDNEGIEFRDYGLSPSSSRAEYCKVYFPKLIVLVIRDCFSSILKVDDSHDFPFCSLGIAMGGM